MPWQLFLEQFNGIVASVFCEVNRYEACDLHGIARKFPSLHDAEVWLAVLTESGSWVASGHSRCQHPQLCVNMLTRCALSLCRCAWRGPRSAVCTKHARFPYRFLVVTTCVLGTKPSCSPSCRRCGFPISPRPFCACSACSPARCRPSA